MSDPKDPDKYEPLERHDYAAAVAANAATDRAGLWSISLVLIRGYSSAKPALRLRTSSRPRKKQNVGGPGQTAAAVVRRVSRAEAEHCSWQAMESGQSAMRAVYAWCYGFETTSGNLKWLRAKVWEAIGDEDDE